MSAADPAIASGSSHTLLLRPDGSVWSCGSNRSGQLGDGSFESRSSPIQVMTDAIAVAAYESTSLFLKSDGTAWATGGNYYGQLGDGSTEDRSGPVQILSDVSALSAGEHNLFLKTDGSVWITGFSENHLPVQIFAGAKAIYAGEFGCFFLKPDGALWAMGTNEYGQFGNGTQFWAFTYPIQIMTGVTAVATGWGHTLFLKSDGSVWAAGDNINGQLGDGTYTDRITAVQVATDVAAIAASDGQSLLLKTDGSVWGAGRAFGLSSSTNRWKQIASNGSAMSAGHNTNFILKTDGSIWAFGENLAGQLGLGLPYYSRPIPIATGVTSISAGLHTLFLKGDGSAWGLGCNDSGALGDGTKTNRTVPVRILDGGVTAVSANTSYSLFLKADGTAWGTGSNSLGQFGIGPAPGSGTWNLLTPVQLSTDVAALSAGVSHSLFIKSNGSAWATGYGYDGQLGIPYATVRYTPGQVMAGVAAVSGGANHSLFLKTDGSAWATGSNANGQLATGDTNFNSGRTTPVQVLQSVAAVSAGTRHSLFLKVDGSAWRAGLERDSQWYIQPYTSFGPLSQVLTGVTALSAGNGQSLFLKSDGTAWASGHNRYGRLGDGSTVDRSTPVQVMTGVAAVSAGYSHSLFLKTDGSLWGAGLNSDGQLGPGPLGYYPLGVRIGTLTPETQTLDFPSVPDAEFGGIPVSLAATASSSLPVSYEVVSGPGLLTGSTLTATATGTITIRATQAGSFAYTEATPVTRTILVTAPSAFTAFLIAAGVPAAERGATADPDHDGVANLLEYALGLAPMSADPASLPAAQAAGSALTLAYRRTQVDVAYAVQTTSDPTDPASWTTAGVSESMPDAEGWVTASTPLVDPACFLRLHVTLLP